MTRVAGNLIKSKKRVRDHGEVFTPEPIVREMLTLVDHEVKNLESKFLEPACGDGNFLSVVLEERLREVERRYRQSQLDSERYAFLALANIYGIDLLEDNVFAARENLFQIMKKWYEKLFKKKQKKKFLEAIKFLLTKNIVQGNALTLKNNKEKPIIFSEWSPVNHVKVKRRDFNFAEILERDLPKNDLFSEENRIKPIKEFPIIHFLRIMEHE